MKAVWKDEGKDIAPLVQVKLCSEIALEVANEAVQIMEEMVTLLNIM
jgi:hypothetical protein